MSLSWSVLDPRAWPGPPHFPGWLRYRLVCLRPILLQAAGTTSLSHTQLYRPPATCFGGLPPAGQPTLWGLPAVLSATLKCLQPQTLRAACHLLIKAICPASSALHTHFLPPEDPAGAPPTCILRPRAGPLFRAFMAEGAVAEPGRHSGNLHWLNGYKK